MSHDQDDQASSNVLESLPIEIWLMITPYLNAKDLLSFCASSRQIQQNSEIRESASYWSRLTISTFRVRNRLVVEHDGRRWMGLYRRMRTQTKPFGWGNNDRGCMGLQQNGGAITGAMRRGRRVHPGHGHMQLHWPKELDLGVEGGVIADLQCGGWSTVTLSVKGVLSLTGMLDGETFAQSPSFKQILNYPPGYVSPLERYDPFTAIRQFSTGRSHVLGVSDSGRIWSWHDARHPAVHIKFLTIDVVESDKRGGSQKHGRVRNVFAGWNRSTAYIEGTGIVVWTPSNRSELAGHSDQSEIDTMLVMEQWVIPHTGYLNSVGRKVQEQRTTDGINVIGEVKTYAVLVHFILFITEDGKLWAAKIPEEAEANHLNAPFRVSSDGQDDEVRPDTSIADVQGAFESFGVLKRNGEVLISDDAYLTFLHARHYELFGSALSTQVPTLRKIPALQNSGVIALAFGDWHFQALHSDGTVSSYGRESEGCGCLGLGDYIDAGIRGLQTNGTFLPQCNTTGRRVQFESEKQLWLKHAREYLDEKHGGLPPDALAELSEQTEWCFKHWEKGPAILDTHSTDSAQDDSVENVSAYFALSVAAAGWHSVALVLVDEEKAEAVRDLYRLKSDPEVSEETGEGEASGVETGAPGGSSVITRTLDLAASLGRRFLGLPAAGSPRPSSVRKDNKPPWIWEQPDVGVNGGVSLMPPPGLDVEGALVPRATWKEIEQVDL